MLDNIFKTWYICLRKKGRRNIPFTFFLFLRLKYAIQTKDIIPADNQKPV